jgi:hypothetical protein
MNEIMTADLTAKPGRPDRMMTESDAARHDGGDETAAANPPAAQLAPLFSERTAGEFRAHWNIIQQGFVDNPQNAVREGDELVARVIKNLAETFSEQRVTLEGEHGSTEELRLALRRYRSFFERLLSI